MERGTSSATNDNNHDNTTSSSSLSEEWHSACIAPTSWASPFQASWWVEPVTSPCCEESLFDYFRSGFSKERQLHPTSQPLQLMEVVGRGDDTTGIPTSTTPNDDIVRTKEKEDQRREREEVLGWTMDAAARGVAIMGTAVFVSSELLKLAKEAAGCNTAADWNGETWNASSGGCDLRVHGMRPSSILANIVMVVGLISAVLMPLIGSLIDHTPHRRAVGSISAACMVTFILFQMMVLQAAWFLAAILQIFIAFSYTVHLCAVYAYLPELTNNHERMVHYTAQFSAAQYSGSVGFLVLMVGILSWLNRDDQFNSATLSQTVVFAICAIAFGYAWTRLFRPRPASQVIPKHRTLITSGFWKIYKTARTILLHHSAIKWFLISAAYTQAATTTFSTLAITYMTEQLGFDARENGIAILILLLFGVPGTRLAAWLTSGFNPIRSLQASLLLWIGSISSASFVLTGPDQQGTAYIFAMIWGLAIGWVYPTEKALYVTIIPRGQEAELMGTYICACQVCTTVNRGRIVLQLGLYHVLDNLL
jgi:MFS transporter, UMF1 family